MSEISLSDVACPSCGGDLQEDDAGCVYCLDCDFQDCDDEEEE